MLATRLGGAGAAFYSKWVWWGRGSAFGFILYFILFILMVLEIETRAFAELYPQGFLLFVLICSSWALFLPQPPMVWGSHTLATSPSRQCFPQSFVGLCAHQLSLILPCSAQICLFSWPLFLCIWILRGSRCLVSVLGRSQAFKAGHNICQNE